MTLLSELISFCFSVDGDAGDQFLEECTMELRAPVGDRIRLVFYPIDLRSDDYEQDDDLLVSKAPCLRIRDVRKGGLTLCVDVSPWDLDG